MVVIVNAIVKKIPKNAYRVIRSFVDSSKSIKYHWNLGVRIGNLVRFVKFGRWILKVFIAEKGLSIELEGYRTKIVYNPDLLLEISVGKEVVFKAESFEKIATTYVESDGIFMEPLPLADLIDKFDFYINAVSMVLAQEQNKETNVN